MAYLLAQVMPEDAEYVDALQGFCDSYLAPFRTVPHTANGLAYPYHGGFPSLHCMRGAALMTAEHVLGSRAHVMTHCMASLIALSKDVLGMLRHLKHRCAVSRS